MKRALPWIALVLVAGALVLARLGRSSRVEDSPPEPAPPRVELAQPTPLVDAEPPPPISAARETLAPDAEPLPAPERAIAASRDVEGVVVDDIGRSFSGVAIVATQLEPPARDGSERSVDVSADGRFRLRALRAGDWSLEAMASLEHRSPPVIVSVPARSPVTLVLARAATVAGVVVDASDVPVENAAVFLELSREESLLMTEPEPRARTDALGRFRIERLPPSTIGLAASSSAHPMSAWTEISLAPGEVRDDVRLVLGGGGRIEGELHPSLVEVAGREIGLYSFDGDVGWREAVTDAAGRFAIESVIPQEYVIELREVVVHGTSDPDHVSSVKTTAPRIRRNVTVVEGETARVVFGEPTPGVVVLGRVTASGEPLERADVSAWPVAGQEDSLASGRTDSAGRFELELRAPGAYRFSVALDRASSARFDREVPDQGIVELSFDVPSCRIAGTVRGADGRPARRVPITLTRDEPATERARFFSDAYRRTTTSEDGAFSFRLLGAGSYTLRSPDGFQFDVPAPRVDHGRAVLSGLEIDGRSSLEGLELSLPAECRITGFVVDANGAPVGDAAIRVLDARGLSLSGDWETTTDGAGRFDVAHVAPGTHTVHAKTRDGREGTSAAILVEPGRTASARVELR